MLALALAACDFPSLEADDVCHETAFAASSRTLECTGDAQASDARYHAFMDELTCGGQLHDGDNPMACAAAFNRADCADVAAHGDAPAWWLTRHPSCPRVFRGAGGFDADTGGTDGTDGDRFDTYTCDEPGAPEQPAGEGTCDAPIDVDFRGSEAFYPQVFAPEPPYGDIACMTSACLEDSGGSTAIDLVFRVRTDQASRVLVRVDSDPPGARVFIADLGVDECVEHGACYDLSVIGEHRMSTPDEELARLVVLQLEDDPGGSLQVTFRQEPL